MSITKSADSCTHAGPIAISQPALCVDLDGTLVRGDLLFETALLLVQRSPFAIFMMVWWLCNGGRTRLKCELAERSTLDAASLSYNQDVLQFVRQEYDSGRTTVLVTASEQSLAEAVAAYCGCFSEVHGTSREVNLKSHAKAGLLKATFGRGEFDYIGNSEADRAVWRSARKVLVTSASKRFISSVSTEFSVDKVFKVAGATPGLIAKQLRVHQWVKNFLLFVPPLMAHELFHFGTLATTALGVLAFSLLASSVYVVNDLLDLEADRLHPLKRNRPFASGALPLHAGALLVPVLLAGAALCAVFLPLSFAGVLLVYLVLTTAYSFRLKKEPIVDIIMLAGLFTIRVLAGGHAASVPVSSWLLTFSLFLFLSLACAKRFSELYRIQGEASGKVPGRGYRASDITMVSQSGITAGYISVLVLALYNNSEAVRKLYATPEYLWLLCPAVLFWVARVWLLAHRGELHEDPILFALKDKQSYLVALIGLVILWSAS